MNVSRSAVLGKAVMLGKGTSIGTTTDTLTHTNNSCLEDRLVCGQAGPLVVDGRHVGKALVVRTNDENSLADRCVLCASGVNGVGANSRLEGCTVGRNVRIGSHVRISHSHIFDDVTIHDNAVRRTAHTAQTN